MTTKEKENSVGLIEWFTEALDATGDKPKDLNEAHANVAYIFTEHPNNHNWQAKVIHDFLKLCPDNDKGDMTRLIALRTLTEKWGPLDSKVIFGLWRLCRVDSYDKVSKKAGKRNIKKHPQQTKRAAFIAWARAHIEAGETPQNIAAIKRLNGFDRTWGTDETIKKWWRGIDSAPALKPGATRT